MTAHEAEDGRDVKDSDILSLHFEAMKTEAWEGGLGKPGITQLPGWSGPPFPRRHAIALTVFPPLKPAMETYRSSKRLHRPLRLLFPAVQIGILIVSGSTGH